VIQGTTIKGQTAALKAAYPSGPRRKRKPKETAK